jgi:hypothetical protein
VFLCGADRGTATLARLSACHVGDRRQVLTESTTIVPTFGPDWTQPLDKELFTLVNTSGQPLDTAKRQATGHSRLSIEGGWPRPGLLLMVQASRLILRTDPLLLLR